MSSFTPSGSGGAPSTPVAPVGIVHSLFSTILSVASASTATVLTYTVPINTTTYMLSIETSGTNIGTYDILLNGSPIARTRTYFSGPFVGLITFGQSTADALQIVAGDIIEVQVTNFRPDAGDFEARFQYVEGT